MKSSRSMLARFAAPAARVAAVALAAGLLAGCQDTGTNYKAIKPIPADTLALMERAGTNKNAPVLIRAYKKESELEVWKMKGDGEYALIKTFPMCRWSGQLGPKRREGDRQVPEGFYTITPGQMNPNSAYYLSFNVGYPNALDRAQGYTGGSIMVHGACSSAGCFSMTDNQIEEIYAIAREAFAGGQRAIQMQSYPFRMNAENFAKHRLDPNMPFWRQLKDGADRFEVTKREPQVGYCNRRYVFDAAAGSSAAPNDPAALCPPLRSDPQVAEAVSRKQKADDAKVSELVERGVQAVKIVYHDGGQHPSMAHVMEVSRPDALAEGPREVALDPKGRPVPAVVQVAAAKAAEKPAVAAKAEATKVEVAKAEPIKAEPAKADEPSTVGKLFSFTSNLPSLFGKSEAAQATETAAPAAPLPPTRPRASAQPAKPKPQASAITQPPVRMAANVARPVDGAAPILGSGFNAR